jgi:hypothetical protein
VSDAASESGVSRKSGVSPAPRVRKSRQQAMTEKSLRSHEALEKAIAKETISSLEFLLIKEHLVKSFTDIVNDDAHGSGTYAKLQTLVTETNADPKQEGALKAAMTAFEKVVKSASTARDDLTESLTKTKESIAQHKGICAALVESFNLAIAGLEEEIESLTYVKSKDSALKTKGANNVRYLKGKVGNH